MNTSNFILIRYYGWCKFVCHCKNFSRSTRARMTAVDTNQYLTHYPLATAGMGALKPGLPTRLAPGKFAALQAILTGISDTTGIGTRSGRETFYPGKTLVGAPGHA
jgi:hypothetical protein